MEELLLWPEGAPLAQGTAPEDRPALFPYLLEGQERAAVIVCPGGGYGMRADHEGEPIARWLNTLGISAFVLRYRVAPYQYPSALLDAQRAIRTVRANAERFSVDPNRIGILGFSAGGHLTSAAATLFNEELNVAKDELDAAVSARPDLAILCYPVVTLQSPFTHEGSRSNLLGTNPDPERVVYLSSEERVTAETPPTFLWHTADDGAVPVENSLAFAAALSRHKVPFDLHVYQHGRHGLGLADDQEHTREWTAACASWLKLNGFSGN
ncbi:alpha/beta hydrolase [Cohnella thailandensis]|uniref:Alpha/beta hydrolase n=1 Tax=Cohnella thailandensis TaxID=557557 RepID=A0A841T5H6_9BACL|nr:alpha/beta hydrolase [Cohnella thailandensis]MBB6638219.1 alpha/beta hydrolase [Cohnella thailandensis]MBP1977780.1 acetyl esterase/lipase [Cohnella thailandensis]